MARFMQETLEPETSEVPEFVRGMPKVPSAPENVRKNKFASRCVVCGVFVPQGVGRLDKQDGKWVVSHIPPCPEGAPEEATPEVNAPTQGHEFKVPEGRYTITFADGSYKTLRVDRQDASANFKPGQVILSYLSGSDNTRDYTSFAHVDDRGAVRVWARHKDNATLTSAVQVLLGDPKAASQAYAQACGCCGICNRPLSTPESLAAGIGPECRRRVSW